MKNKFLFYSLLGCFFPLFICGAQTKYVNLQGVTSFAKGDFQNIQMDAQGRLSLSADMDMVYDTKNLLVQSTVKTDKGIYFSTAKDAGLFMYDPSTKSTTKIYENSQALSIPSFVVDDHMLYFVESPSNTLYSIDLSQTDATPQKIQTFKMVNYIWQMAIDNKQLYLATGSKAGLYRLPLSDLSSKPEEVFHADEENHFLTLVIQDGFAYLGSEGTGGLYKVNLKDGTSQLLYKAYEGEISDIIVTDNNGIFFTTSNKQPKSVGQDFDYTDTLLSQQLEYQMVKSHLMETKQLNPDGTLKDNTGLAVKNSLYQFVDGHVNKLITLDNLTLNKLFLADRNTFFIGTSNGRMFQYQMKNNRLFLMASIDNEDVTGIVPIDDDSFLVTTSNIGQIYTVKRHLSTTGTFISDIIDLGGDSILGHMTLDTDHNDHGKVTVSVRGGATQSPDNNWLSWQKISDNMDLSKLKSLRYLQYKIEITSKDDQSPEFIRLLTPYLSSNHMPSITLFTAFYDPAQLASPQQNLQIRWSALDSDHDQLIYRIYFKQRQDVTWSLLTETNSPEKINVDTRVFPDGVYQFKLQVSDELDNAPERSGKAEQLSNFVLINNSPPAIKIEKSTSAQSQVTIQGTFESKASLIAKAYYKIGVGLDEKWKFIVPDHQIYDGKSLTFQIRIDKKSLKDPENYIFIRVFDVNMNQTSVRVKLNQNGKMLDK